MFSTAALGPGQHQITASYAGNGNLLPASATTVVTVLPHDFSVTTGSAAMTIETRHHASMMVGVTTTGKLVDVIDLSCGGLPYIASCTFAQAVGDGGRVGYAGVDAAAGGYGLPSGLCAGSSGCGVGAVWRWQRCCPLLLGGGLWRRRRLPVQLLVLLVGLGAATALMGCSGMEPGHTPPGTYVVEVTGHAARHRGDAHGAG